MYNQQYYTRPNLRYDQLMCTLQRLWIEHVLWTRAFLVGTAFNLPDLKYTTDRLLRNPADFADVLRPLYGDNIAQKFEELLKEHLLIAAQLVNAAKTGDSQTASQQRMKWYANADSIASFLGSINPYWNVNTWRAMLYDHLKMTENEAVQLLQGQYEASIAQYDAIQNEAVQMAQEMANGIARQFGI
jgi:hypothetical protein